MQKGGLEEVRVAIEGSCTAAYRLPLFFFLQYIRLRTAQGTHSRWRPLKRGLLSSLEGTEYFLSCWVLYFQSWASHNTRAAVNRRGKAVGRQSSLDLQVLDSTPASEARGPSGPGMSPRRPARNIKFDLRPPSSRPEDPSYTKAALLPLLTPDRMVRSERKMQFPATYWPAEDHFLLLE